MNSKSKLFQFMTVLKIKPGLVYGLIIFSALIAFEIFNYSTTDFALQDLLGDLRFAGVRWATILAIAFCGIDFAGIARLFTPQANQDEPRQVWYLFGAWLLAATMNAMLTWWGVALAISTHAVQSETVMAASTVKNVVPVFVAVMVWVIRVLIIGSISSAADHMLGLQPQPAARPVRSAAQPAVEAPARTPSQPSHRPVYTASAARTTPAPVAKPAPVLNSRPEPTYHRMESAGAAPAEI